MCHFVLGGILCIFRPAAAQTNCSNDFMLEADVYPPTTLGEPGGDGQVRFLDWQTIYLFAAGLRTPYDICEFARADCAPRANLGDGIISTSDVVQAFRYAVGWDSPPLAGGPTNVIPTSRLPGLGSRSVFVSSNGLIRGQDNLVTIFLNAAGDEYELGLSLTFDPGQLRYKGVTNTLGNVKVNTNLVSNGRLGLLTDPALQPVAG